MFHPKRTGLLNYDRDFGVLYVRFDDDYRKYRLIEEGVEFEIYFHGYWIPTFLEYNGIWQLRGLSRNQELRGSALAGRPVRM